jgi:N-acetylglutamate synthase-like GNAT family acetyltransferase
MQIRIANRQDEKRVQALSEEICQEFGHPFDLDKADQDLKNIEAKYIGQDGICLVAEEEKQIVGFAGASKHDDELLVLRRISLHKDWRHKGIGRQMIKIVMSHAQRMGFKTVELGHNPFESKNGESSSKLFSEDPAAFFSACGFPQLDETTSTGRLTFAPYLLTQ